MPRVKYVNAVTTKSSIASLWAMAETEGEVSIRLRDRRAAYLTRNKLYAHRAALRKTAGSLTGIESSHLDGYKITYRPEIDSVDEDDTKWILTISFEDIIEFELLLPETFDGELPHFDTREEVPIQPIEELYDGDEH